VSSTSWTEDEDFGVLLEALVALDAEACAHPASFPDFVVVVTGKGPQKAMYEARMAALHLRRVHVRTAWLAAGDYPLLLGSADLGVCLHFSTSGLDLPMKVVDMFGCGLPVCAVQYSCLAELVKHDVNGLVFRTPAELAQQLVDLFRGFPGEPSARMLARLRRGVEGFQQVRWADNWNRNARPLFTSAAVGPA
jgi:beta-1,4-mannosyltransferase